MDTTRTILFGFVLLVMFVLSLSNYLLFHTLVEIAIAVLAFIIFSTGVNTKKFNHNSFLHFLSVSFLVIGCFTIFHALSYPGCNILGEGSYNLTMKFWISSGYIEGVSFLIAAYLLNINKKIDFSLTLIAYVLLGGLVSYIIFFTEIFPVAYIESEGRTLFAVFSELLIAVIFASSLYLFLRGQQRFSSEARFMIFTAIVLRIISQIGFPFIAKGELYNHIMHLIKFTSYYCIYLGLVEESLRKPYETLFNDYNKTQERLVATGTFLVTSFHDIKNPLATIRGLGQIVSMKAEGEKTKEYSEKIIDEVDGLSDMINKLINTFKANNREQVNPVILIEEVLEEKINPLASAYDIEIDINADTSPQLVLQREMFKRAVHNLLKNAVEAMPDGGKITVDLITSNASLLIKISDNGPGIPPEHQERLFQPFVSGNNSTGLGLYMVHYTITKVHNGRIWFETDQGEGTTFYIELPTARD